MVLSLSLAVAILVKIRGIYTWVMGVLCIVTGVSMRASEASITPSPPHPDNS
jgi:hypothetical protein